MHRCFLVPELVRMICTQLQLMAFERGIEEGEQEPAMKEYKRTLYRLAITCQAFKETALDILWSDIDSLQPLLRCLPVTVDTRTGYIAINRPLGNPDFEIFQKYACRVRSVSCHSRNVQRGLVRMLCNFPCTPGTTLLPNLKDLVWFDDNEEIFPYFRFLIPPTLHHLNFSGAAWPHSKLSFISFLHQYLPDLKEFSCAGVTPGAMPFITEYICNAKQLSSIDIGAPSAKAMTHLMNSPTLRRLTISLPTHNNWEHAKGTFPSTLNHFVLRTYMLDKAATFLRAVKLSPAHVTVEFKDIAHGSLVQPFFEKLTKAIDLDKLEEFQYSNPDVEHRTQQPIYDLETLTLTPLFKFKNLVSVYLENSRTPLMDDNMAKCIADAWPRLKELRIGTLQWWKTNTGLPRQSKLTLWGFGYVVQNCRNLVILGLVFDPTTECETIPAHWSNSNIRRLEVGPSPIDNPVAIAATFVHLLPSLRGVWIDRYEVPIYAPAVDVRVEKWEMVAEMMRVLASVKDVVRREARREVREEERGKMLKEMAEASGSKGSG
ncbi:hypothetical protein PAXINDRAFT_170688 [Paxillus involutus ATCC 200175]|uniref:Uncharacterized protein n=1 Tax=Paxillus involutus ATCC 200175 TaxID=664439 RepID=A0A0C9TSB9_PAXIN|nr:hypothetical protein PAXINDRAFT_170688 [Paxillus involutus ATCC 200175]